MPQLVDERGGQHIPEGEAEGKARKSGEEDLGWPPFGRGYLPFPLWLVLAVIGFPTGAFAFLLWLGLQIGRNAQ